MCVQLPRGGVEILHRHELIELAPVDHWPDRLNVSFVRMVHQKIEWGKENVRPPLGNKVVEAS